ncbi:TPA: FecR domain-containing protein [Stenotrophomonas maltophilia]|nr:FecR domain-containing protein [Stenotrophomonas sp. CD2]HEL5042522.1 FecR domain-containing protein [Stenotrophomonas maltophilia]
MTDLPSAAGSDPFALHEAAAAWLVRRQDTAWQPKDEAALQHWLAESETHRQAFADVTRTWQDLGHLSRPVLASDAHAVITPAVPAPAALRRGRAARRARSWRLPRVAAAAAVAMLALGYVGYGWYAAPSYVQDVATGAGEIRDLQLPDGSRISLNARSTLAVHFYRSRREVVLSQGEAFFEVAPAADRPFTVDAQRSRVTVVGTAFNVRNGPGEVVVKVLHGHVRVQPDRAEGASPVSLRAEQGLAVTTLTAAYRSIAASADSIGGWRNGRLVFRRTPLDEVAQEVGQYLGHPVTLGQPGLKFLPVSGYAATDAPATFLEALPDLLPVQVTRTAQGGYRIDERPVTR